MIYIIGILVLITTIYFFSIGWIIIGFIKIKKETKTGAKCSSKNKISIIIPVRNEENNILNCLESLRKQYYERESYEVIIVNDHSTDNTCEAIKDFIEKSELTICLFSLADKTSKKEALSFGIEKAKFEIITTTDADCILPNNWLNNISNQFTKNIEMLLGPVMFKKGKGFLSAFQTLDMLAIQGMEFGALGHQTPILNNAANLSYSKTSYQNVNGFDSFKTPSGDDIFLLEKFKLKNQKIKGLLSQDFIVETKSEATLIKFLHQRLRWASKSKYYSDNLLLFFSSIVLFQNVTLFFIYFGLPLVEKYGVIFIILLVSKWLIDFILLFLVASFFKREKALFYFIPIQITYPIYIVLVWLLSMSIKFEWKGRKF